MENKKEYFKNYYDLHKDKFKMYQQKYVNSHLEILIEKRRKLYLIEKEKRTPEKKEELAKYQKEYYQNNPDKKKETSKKYYQKNLEKMKEKGKEYYEKHKEIHNNLSKKRYYKNREIVNCECGIKCYNQNIKAHLLTQKHKTILENRLKIKSLYGIKNE